jgi:hypothetical protein
MRMIDSTRFEAKEDNDCCVSIFTIFLVCPDDWLDSEYFDILNDL